jgi:hypothetical protein
MIHRKIGLKLASLALFCPFLAKIGSKFSISSHTLCIEDMALATHSHVIYAHAFNLKKEIAIYLY